MPLNLPGQFSRCCAQNGMMRQFYWRMPLNHGCGTNDYHGFWSDFPPYINHSISHYMIPLFHDFPNQILYFNYDPNETIPFSPSSYPQRYGTDFPVVIYRWYLPRNFPLVPTFRHLFKGHYSMIISYRFHSIPIKRANITYSTTFRYLPSKSVHDFP